MNNKKSQGMPINVLIIAVISLVVLVVVLAIFSINFGKASQNIGSCVTKNGKCADSKGECETGYHIKIFVSGDCPNSDPKNLCCIKAGIDETQPKK